MTKGQRSRTAHLIQVPAGVFRRPGVIPLPGRFPPRHDLVYPVKPACTLVAGLVYARCYARHHADLPACLHMFGVLFTPGVITCTVRMCGIHADLPPARQPPWWRCGLTPGYGPAMRIMHAPSAMTYLRATRFMAEQPRRYCPRVVCAPCGTTRFTRDVCVASRESNPMTVMRPLTPCSDALPRDYVSIRAR